MFCAPRALVAALVAAWIAVAPAGAEDAPRFSFPVRCALGESCWVAVLPDVEPVAGVARDHACGDATYDGHKGTDFAIPDLAAMRAGVGVLAAAPGVVVGVRNTVRDVAATGDAGRTAVKDSKCGNGVRVDHGAGWFTQYCHMRQGSVAVNPGAVLKRGQYLGLVGLSGLTEFPHLHFQVEHAGRVIDPFRGAATDGACGPGRPLWSDPPDGLLAYRPTAVFNAGFAPVEPKEAAAREGLYRDEVLPLRTPVLALWTEIFQVREGDRITLVVRDPDGRTILDHGRPAPKSKDRAFLYAGLNAKGRPWRAGTYTGEITLTRAAPAHGEPATASARRTVVLK